jgi:hypothetical protein
MLYVILTICCFFSIKTISRNSDWKENYSLFLSDSKDLKNNALYIKSYKSLGYVKFDLSQIWSGDKELHENVVNIISNNN